MKQTRMFEVPDTGNEGTDDVARVLSLNQPWASLMASGFKPTETRDWYTPYRGLLGIHATKGWKKDDIMLAMEPPFTEALLSVGIRKPRDLITLGGNIIAVVDLYDCVRMTTEMCERVQRETPLDYAFGLWLPGRCAWLTRGLKKLDTPIPFRGGLGLLRWPEGRSLFGTPNSA